MNREKNHRLNNFNSLFTVYYESGAFNMISQEGLREFIEIYREEFGVLLTNEEALEKALPVLNLVKNLVQPKSSILINKDSVDGSDGKV